MSQQNENTAQGSGRLAGKVVLVTGATSGIGRETVLEIARQGASVAFTGRRAELGESLLGEVEAIAPGRGLFVRADHAKEADNKRAVDETVARFGRLDGAVNNAGVEGEMGPITEVTVENYRHVYDINVLGVLLSLKHQAPAILKSGGGSIVITSSGLGHIGMPNVAIYTGSKHAVEGIAKSAALELAPQGVRVNTVAPAVVETPMAERFIGPGGDEAREYMKSLHPIGRFAQPIEIAQPIVFLLSDESSFITGQSLRADGGMTAQ